MGKQFGTVEIFAFDLHTCLRPLFLQTVQNRLEFLVKPEEYRKAYGSAGTKIDTKNFTISPLSPHAIKRHHLWSRYTATQTAAQADFWALQMPFVCKAKNVKLCLAPATGLKGEIQASVCLFPMGWSTQIEILLEGTVAGEDMVKLSSMLHASKPILHSGQERSLAEIFRWFSHRLTSDVYNNFQNADDNIPVPRHLIFSLGNYSGPMQPYKPGSPAGMPPQVRALMHSIVLGREISPNEVVDLEIQPKRKNKFLLTELRDAQAPDFAITHFDHGSLLLVQKPLSSKAKLESFHCFGSNVRYFSLLALAWAGFDSALSQAEPRPPTHASDLNPKQQLIAFRRRYKSKFSERFYESHKALSTLMKD